MKIQLDLNQLNEKTARADVMISLRITKEQYKLLKQNGNVSKTIRFLVDAYLKQMEKKK